MSGYTTGARPNIDEEAIVGYEHDPDAPPTSLGDDATVRAQTIVYRDVVVGDDFSTGHNALVREESVLGDDVLVGTGTVIDGKATVGSHVSLQSRVYLPPNTTIEDNVFVGPNAVLTDDPYPIRVDGDDHRNGPTLKAGSSVGANATILPDVTVGEGSFVAAGAVVTEDVPPETLAVGVPAKHEPLPDTLDAENLLS